MSKQHPNRRLSRDDVLKTVASLKLEIPEQAIYILCRHPNPNTARTVLNLTLVSQRQVIYRALEKL